MPGVTLRILTVCAGQNLMEENQLGISTIKNQGPEPILMEGLLPTHQTCDEAACIQDLRCSELKCISRAHWKRGENSAWQLHGVKQNRPELFSFELGEIQRI